MMQHSVKSIKYLSLFTGIGGFEIGIDNAYEEILRDANRSEERRSEENKKSNERQRLLPKERESISTAKGLVSKCTTDDSYKRPLCIGYSEIDTTAINIYQKHYPQHNNYGDITKIKTDELPDFDLLIGGFPCQAFSIAGKRQGFEDTRGTLFFEIARILREKQPRLFVLENVKGLLSHDDGRTFRTIVAALDELRYDIQWQVLNSKNYGVPQNRERVYIVGHLRGTSRPQVFPIDGDNEQASTSIRRIAHMRGFRRYNQTYEAQGQVEALDTAQGGGHQPCIVAQRGRYKEDGKTEQRLEVRKDNLSNTLTSVEKDNMVFVPEAVAGGVRLPGWATASTWLSLTQRHEEVEWVKV